MGRRLIQLIGLVLLVAWPVACGTTGPTPTAVVLPEAARSPSTGTPGASSSSPAALPAATPALALAATPAPASTGNCLGVPPPARTDPPVGVGVNGDGPRPTPEFAQYADLAVTGQVIAILPARFTTPDCGWPIPRDPLLDHDAPSAEFNAIITPVVLALDGGPVVARPGIEVPQGSLVIALEGGQVGPYSVNVSGPGVPNLQFFQPGESMLVVPRHRREQQPGGVVPTEAGPAAWSVILAYTRNQDGTATGYGQSWQLDELFAALRPQMAAPRGTP